tara:strand:- start:2004 stop:2759 length:756 start_codon:yes stop_codon:yes gene_type:complete
MKKISKIDLSLFNKQLILKNVGFSGQNKIFSKKILVIGIGGLGCPLLLYLARSGIKNLGIVDGDKVEISNLNRQILFNIKDLGKYKVDKALLFLKNFSKNIRIQKFKTYINKNNIDKIASNYDIICDGTDNFKSRLLINDFCVKKRKYLISAAISKFDGHLMTFNFNKLGPCFRCYMPKIPREENNCSTEGIISTIGGIIGSLQANEVIRVILKNGILESNMTIYDGIKNKFRHLKIEVNKKCINGCYSRH